MERWRFLYTTLPSYKNAVTKTKAPNRGMTKFIVTTGKNYSEAYSKARKEGKFKEQQLLGSNKI